jgi:hypothetical protein
VEEKDFDTLNLSPEDKEALRRNFFFNRLPCVSRVVFISTPHRGSYLATALVRKLARKFMSLPQEMVGFSLRVVSNKPQAPSQVRHNVPTSIDGMSPKSPYLLALADLPPAPGVQAHSIIAIRGKDEPPEGGDGVVKYRSAHVPYVESEFIVRSGHSCQGKPETIEEVRRILLEHLAELNQGQPTNGSAPPRQGRTSQ